MPEPNFRDNAEYDLLICGASFAGLSLACELRRNLDLAGADARILLIDRYDIGERQTSACAAPTEWLKAVKCEGSIRQTFSELTVNTAYGKSVFKLPFSFSTFDYRKLCEQLFERARVPFETATVRELESGAVLTDRGPLRAKLIADCLGWRSILRSERRQPPEAPLSRGLEVHPSGSGSELEIWIDRAIVPAGYAWSFPAQDELRVGVGSFDPHFHVRRPTEKLAEELDLEAVRYQGNWIPHKLNTATEGEIFFVGDSAGHCLPLTAEGIRTAFYFGTACGRELSQVLTGQADSDQALRRYEAFCSRHDFQFKWLLRVQKLVPKIPPPILHLAVKLMQNKRFTAWAFNHYLRIAHPSYATVHASYLEERTEELETLAA